MHLPKNLCKDPRVSGPRRGTADTASIVTCALLAGGSHWAISLMAWSTSGTRPAPRMKLCMRTAIRVALTYSLDQRRPHTRHDPLERTCLLRPVASEGRLAFRN